MLYENLKQIRKSKGLSQQELAIQLNVVRQTVSKWEQGLSVPDCEMLIRISEILDTPVSVLLSEDTEGKESDVLEVISNKLEIINFQLAKRQENRRKIIQVILIVLCICILLIFVALINYQSSYLNWNYGNPEQAVLGVGMHILEWTFVRVAPIGLVVAAGILIWMKKKR